MFRQNAVLRLACLAFLISLSWTSWASGLFHPPQRYKSGGQNANAIAVGDVNLDGKPDLLVANGSADRTELVVGVLLGNGDGTFQAAQSYSAGGYGASSISVADVNGDGSPDLLVATCSSNCIAGAVAVLFGNGDGTFKAPVIYNSGGQQASFVIVADVDRDGRPDVLVANICDTACDHGSVAVLRGNGDGTFQPAITYASGGYAPVSIAMGDSNADGNPDLLLLNQCIDADNCADGSPISNLAVLLGNGDGSFRDAVAVSLAGLFTSMAVADVNEDGKLDVLVGDYSSVAVLLGSGDGTFHSGGTYNSGGEIAESIAVGDVNGDAIPDLLVGSRCVIGYCSHGVVGVLVGTGGGTFGPPKVYGSNGDHTMSIALGDVNQDGRPDLLVANTCFRFRHCSEGGGVAVFTNASKFATATNLNSSLNPSPYGQPVTLTATVSSAGPAPHKGTVTFENGGVVLRTVKLNGSVATLTTAKLPAGTLSIIATYNGDAELAKSTSTVLIQVVDQPLRQ